jgi:hypothetical protein
VKSLLKSLLAVLLGLGFLALQSRAAPAPEKKTAIAFLGLTEASDPQISAAIAKRIRGEIGADSALVSIPGEEVDKLFAKGILRAPDARPEDPEALRREVGEAYLAYGSLEGVAVTSKRILWKPWSLKNTWTQGMRLHVVDGTKGEVVYDGRVAAAVPESGFLFAPEEDWGKVPPLERERRMRIMAEAISVEAAKALAKAVKGRAAAPATAGGNAPVSPG